MKPDVIYEQLPSAITAFVHYYCVGCKFSFRLFLVDFNFLFLLMQQLVREGNTILMKVKEEKKPKTKLLKISEFHGQVTLNKKTFFLTSTKKQNSTSLFKTPMTSSHI